MATRKALGYILLGLCVLQPQKVHTLELSTDVARSVMRVYSADGEVAADAFKLFCLDPLQSVDKFVRFRV